MNFKLWLEAEASENGKQDVYTYLAKNWAQLKGNYFVYIPSSPTYQKGIGSFKNIPSRNISNFNYLEKGTTCFGLEEFLKKGFELDLFGNQIYISDNQPVILLTTNSNVNIQCLDSTDERNPFWWIKERFQDYKDYAKNLNPENKKRFNEIEQEIERVYRYGTEISQDHPNAYKVRLERLLWLINIETPKILGNNFAKWVNRPSKTTAPLTSKMKGVSQVGVDIISHSCPLSKSNWVLVFNPKSIKRVDSIEIKKSFTGLKRTDAGQILTQSKNSRQFDAMNEKIQNLLGNTADRLSSIIENELSFTINRRILESKKLIIKNIETAGNLSASLAKSQPNLAEELISRFQHILDQLKEITEGVYRERDAYLDGELPAFDHNYPDYFVTEAKNWEQIEGALHEAIKKIKKPIEPNYQDSF